jgi:surfeit locus 1 family protein
MRGFSNPWPHFFIGTRNFAPPLLATLVVLGLLPVLISLGFWQWHRAQSNVSILQAFTLGTQSKFIALPLDPAKLHSAWSYQRVWVEGEFDPKFTFLLDNAMQDHQVGYRVLGVFIPHNSQARLLVERGFIAKSKPSVQGLPILPAPVGQRRLSGMLVRPYIPAVRFTDERTPATLLDAEDLQQLRTRVTASFYPLVLVQISPDPAGLAHALPSPPDKVLMHQGYALQWWAFAFTLVAGYLVVNFKKRHA